jgi:hypothetical protein
LVLQKQAIAKFIFAILAALVRGVIEVLDQPAIHV